MAGAAQGMPRRRPKGSDGRRLCCAAPSIWVCHDEVRRRALHAPVPCRYLHLDACLYEDPQIVNDLYLG